MKDIRWFEKKWFVNQKVRTRYNLCFLSVAIVGAAVGAAGIWAVLSSGIQNPWLFSAIIGAVCILNIILALVLGNINAFLVVDPMSKNEKILKSYAVGNFDTENIIRKRDFVTLNYQDEIGRFSRTLAELMNYMANLEKCIRTVAEGDLSVKVPVCSPNDQIGNALTDLVNHFHTLVASIVVTVEQVTSSAGLVSETSTSVSEGTTNQASTVQELTASLEEISEQTRLNAKNAEQANDLAKSAKSNAAEGNTQMREMLQAMDEISSSSANINKIIKVIDDIAFQTNILALNAAVEAARAGQHGKGFAVVAEEVRNLAAKSANAVKETTDMIENSIRKVETGTKIANSTAEALDEIVTQVDSAADLINSIAEASAEQARGIEQVNLGISQVSQVVQTNAATAEESAAASEELSSQAAHLNERISKFRLRKRKSGAAAKSLKIEIPEKETVSPALPKPVAVGENMGKY